MMLCSNGSFSEELVNVAFRGVSDNPNENLSGTGWKNCIAKHTFMEVFKVMRCIREKVPHDAEMNEFGQMKFHKDQVLSKLAQVFQSHGRTEGDESPAIVWLTTPSNKLRHIGQVLLVDIPEHQIPQEESETRVTSRSPATEGSHSQCDQTSVVDDFMLKCTRIQSRGPGDDLKGVNACCVVLLSGMIETSNLPIDHTLKWESAHANHLWRNREELRNFFDNFEVFSRRCKTCFLAARDEKKRRGHSRLWQLAFEHDWDPSPEKRNQLEESILDQPGNDGVSWENTLRALCVGWTPVLKDHLQVGRDMFNEWRREVVRHRETQEGDVPKTVEQFRDELRKTVFA